MARRRRRLRVPFGETRARRTRRPRPWPEAEDLIRRDGPGRSPDDPPAPPGSPGPPPTGYDDGGAGVREPRRPKPTLPGMAASATPDDDQYLDLRGAGAA